MMLWLILWSRFAFSPSTATAPAESWARGLLEESFGFSVREEERDDSLASLRLERDSRTQVFTLWSSRFNLFWEVCILWFITNIMTDPSELYIFKLHGTQMNLQRQQHQWIESQGVGKYCARYVLYRESSKREVSEFCPLSWWEPKEPHQTE
jgi:hypothetical protein